MKSKSDFVAWLTIGQAEVSTHFAAKEYRDYRISYFAGQIACGMFSNPQGEWSNEDHCIQRATALVDALEEREK
jgi:hypothetical protein